MMEWLRALFTAAPSTNPPDVRAAEAVIDRHPLDPESVNMTLGQEIRDAGEPGVKQLLWPEAGGINETGSHVWWSGSRALRASRDVLWFKPPGDHPPRAMVNRNYQTTVFWWQATDGRIHIGGARPPPPWNSLWPVAPEAFEAAWTRFTELASYRKSHAAAPKTWNERRSAMLAAWDAENPQPVLYADVPKEGA